MWPRFLLHWGPLLGEPTEPSPALLLGPSCWAVTGAGFWRSRALSQLLPPSVRMGGEADGLVMACVSLSVSQTQQLGQEKPARTETMHSPPNLGATPRAAILAMQCYSAP